MKTPSRLTNIGHHTRILWIFVWLIIVAALIMLYRQFQWDIVEQNREHAQVRFIGTTGEQPIILTVDIADTPYKHEYGLMFRWQIGWWYGMMFVFPDEVMRSFWMKNTYIPLDMMFLNSSGVIVHIHPGAKPLDETPISSFYPAKYVIETNSWWTQEAGLTTGMAINLNTLN